MNELLWTSTAIDPNLAFYLFSEESSKKDPEFRELTRHFMDESNAANTEEIWSPTHAYYTLTDKLGEMVNSVRIWEDAKKLGEGLLTKFKVYSSSNSPCQNELFFSKSYALLEKFSKASEKLAERAERQNSNLLKKEYLLQKITSYSVLCSFFYFDQQKTKLDSLQLFKSPTWLNFLGSAQKSENLTEMLLLSMLIKDFPNREVINVKKMISQEKGSYGSDYLSYLLILYKMAFKIGLSVDDVKKDIDGVMKKGVIPFSKGISLQPHQPNPLVQSLLDGFNQMPLDNQIEKKKHFYFLMEILGLLEKKEHSQAIISIFPLVVNEPSLPRETHFLLEKNFLSEKVAHSVVTMLQEKLQKKQVHAFSDPSKAIKKLAEVIAPFRNFTYLSIYFKNIFSSDLPEEEKTAVASAGFIYIKSLIEENWPAVRYDINHSPHLKRVLSINPTLFDLWKQEYSEPLSDFCRRHQIDIKDGVEEEQAKLWKIKVSDHPWDMFVLGSDMEDSCQHVKAPAIYNKALLGYPLDGKNRLAYIQNEKDVIELRVILRLLLDTSNQRMFLFQERNYPKSPKHGLKKALDIFCRERAQNLNLPLVSSVGNSELPSSDSTSLDPTLSSLGTELSSFEYVDALKGIEKQGKFKIPSGQYIIIGN